MNPPYGIYRERETAFWWAHTWYRDLGVRYLIRMWWVPGERSPRWSVDPTKRPAPRRTPSLGVVTVSHLSHDLTDPGKCRDCGEHPTLTWAHTDEWHESGLCVDCLMGRKTA